jgi:hypothetical protein
MSESERIQSGPPQPQGPGEDPLYHYNRLLVRFLQLVFQTFDKGNYHWDDDDEFTEITISDQATIGRDAVEKRPAIIVARGPASFGNLAIDQFSGPRLSKKEGFVPNFDPVSGARRHTDLVAASSSFNCLSSNGPEAQRIAWICGMAVRRLKRSLMRAGFHRIGEEIQFGTESAPGALVQPDSHEIVMMTVSVPFFFQDFWTIEPADKVLLKKLDLALRSTVNFSPGVAALNAPAINGRILEYDRDKALSLTQRVHLTSEKTPKPRK